MKIQKKIYILALYFTSFLAVAQSKLDSILSDFNKHPERILVAAHRAAHNNYPENSLASIKEAIRLGVDIIETDIRETKDGILVCVHDQTIDRTTTGKGKVEDLTYAELQRYFLLHKGKPTSEKIPTFEEVLQLAKGKIMVDIDFKASGNRATLSTVKLLAKLNMEEQCLFFLYDYKEAIAIQKMNDKIQFMPRAYSASEVKNILKMPIIAPAIHSDTEFYTEELMGEIRKNGKRVWMNTLGEYDDMELQKKDSGFDAFIKNKQVNIIQTNFPEELLVYLQKKGLHR